MAKKCCELTSILVKGTVVELAGTNLTRALILTLIFLILLLFNHELLFVVVTSEQISRSSALLTGFDRKWFIPDCMAFYLKDASV